MPEFFDFDDAPTTQRPLLLSVHSGISESQPDVAEAAVAPDVAGALARLAGDSSDPSIVADDLAFLISLIQVHGQPKIVSSVAHGLATAKASLWQILKTFPGAENKEHLIGERLVHLYFSIPDRLLAAMHPSACTYTEITSGMLAKGQLELMDLNDFEHDLPRKEYAPLLRKIRQHGLADALIECFFERSDERLSMRLANLLESAGYSDFMAILHSVLVKLHDSSWCRPHFSDAVGRLLDALTAAKKELASEILVRKTLFAGRQAWPFMLGIVNFAMCEGNCLSSASQAAEQFAAKFVRHLVDIWQDKRVIGTGPSELHRNLAAALLAVLGYVSEDLCESTGIAHGIMEGIQHRLDQSRVDLRMQGMLVGEHFSAIVSRGLCADSSKERVLRFEDIDRNSEMVREYERCYWCGSDVDSERATIDGRPWVSLERVPERSAPAPPSCLVETVDKTGCSRLPKEAEPRNAKLKKPKFIRDLLEMFRDDRDPLKFELALTSVEEVVHVTGRLALWESMPELFKTLLLLGDTYELPGFEETRVSAMTRCMLREPKIVGAIFSKEFFGTNLVVSQKTALLTMTMNCVKASRQNGRADSREAIVEQGNSMALTARLVGDADLATIVECIFPIMVQGARSNMEVFRVANGILLETFILCLGTILQSSVHLTAFASLVESFLEISKLWHGLHLPSNVLKALLLAYATVFETWPMAALSPIRVGNDLLLIGGWLNEIVNMHGEDGEMMTILVHVYGKLQELGDPQKILAMAMEELQLDISPSEPTALKYK